MTDLAVLGWDASLSSAFAEQAAAGDVPGRVALEHNHVYRVFTADGEWLAETSGRLKYRAEKREALPTVGDWVGLRRSSAQARAAIRCVLPRRSAFSRRAAGRETEEQVLAANIDTVLLVFTLEIAPKLRSIERYLLLARQSGAAPVVVLNKADCADDLSAAVNAAVAVASGAPVHAVSARDGRGFEWLEPYLVVGRTVALLGPSGVGKSSILNRLIGHDLLPTGAVRDRDLRGRHTSVHRQLVVLDRGGIVIDTPGMRELQLWDPNEGLDETFADFMVLADGCRFRNCRHASEPGCAVKAAVADGRVDAARYDGYLKLAAEQAVFDTQQAERERIDSEAGPPMSGVTASGPFVARASRAQ